MSYYYYHRCQTPLPTAIGPQYVRVGRKGMQSYEREGRNDEERKGEKRRKDGSKENGRFLRSAKLGGKLGRN